MAVKVWDTQANAFKDAEIPMVWDGASGAYKESTGLVYDESTGAWDERWGAEQEGVLYNKGNECVKVTGGWASTVYATNSVVKMNSDNMYLHTYRASVHTRQKVDLSGYNKLIVRFSQIKGRSSSSYATVLILIANSLADQTQYNWGWGISFERGYTKRLMDIDSAATTLTNKILNDYELSMDISQINTQQYICITVDDDNSTAYGYITEVYLSN